MDRSDTHPQSRSIMVVSEAHELDQVVAEAFPADQNNSITRANESFQAMNGRAVDLAFDHDIVIFEADPDNATEVDAIKTLLEQRSAKTVFLALTDNDVSIVKARALRQIGIDEVLPKSIDGEGLRIVAEEHISARHVPAQAVFDGAGALGQVYMVSQSRGGVGSTTVAVNLAASLAGAGSSLFRKAAKSRVVLLDLDLQFGNANVFLDLEDNGGFLQIIEATEEPDDHFIASTLQTHPLGFDVLSAPQPFLPLQSVHSNVIENVIEHLQKRYDYIIIDLPRAVVDWVAPALKRAAKLVLVTDTSVPCVRQARRMMDLYREENVALPVEVVVNRDKQPLVKSEHVREAEKVLETKLVHWLPDNPKLARNAVDVGRPVVEMKPRSDLGKALIKLGKSLSSDQQRAKSKEV